MHAFPRMIIGLLAMGAAALAIAQSFPSKPVRIVVSYAAGGGVDLMARLVAQELQQQLGRPVIVENRTGASGTIGADAVAKSVPDGHTILAGGNPELTFMPVVSEKLPYDAQRDLVPLVLAANAPSVIVVNPGSGITSVAQLIERARAPAGLPYGTPGRGTPMHLAFELLNAERGTHFTHVPYKGGGPATNDVLAGQVSVAVINAPPLMPHIRAGKLRALAILQDERSALLADVPTLREASGIAGIQAPAWFAFSAPSKVPPDVLARLEREIIRALAVAGVNAKLAGAGLDVIASPASRMAEIIRSETAYNAATIKRLGFRPD